jgi:hypothetical protein
MNNNGFDTHGYDTPSSLPYDSPTVTDTPDEQAEQAEQAESLTLAEEQRTANLLALLALPETEGVVITHLTRVRALNEVTRRLGLNSF